MQKITIKELVNFRRKSDKTKRTFAYKLKFRKPKEKTEIDSDGGGDYWITSTSCIYNVFKYNKKEFYDSKIDELHSKYEISEDKRIKSMYQRNIDILISFKDFELADLKPSHSIKFEKVAKAYKILTVKDFPLFVNPSLLFSYEKNGKIELGALWLIPQLEGFSKVELGMFCEVLYRFLIKNFSADYQVSQDYCIVIDTFNAQKLTYKELIKGNTPFLIDIILNEIKEL